MPPPNTPEEGVPGEAPVRHASSYEAPLGGLPSLPASASTSRVASNAGSRPSSRHSSEPASRRTSASLRDPLDTLKPAIEPIDYQALEYVDSVDETLVCPICKTPFYLPVTANKCGHTFCSSCLKTAAEIQPLCPLDREPLDFRQEFLHSTRIITHQLDRLKVKCPNRLCSSTPTRNLLQSHYERQCEYTMVPCPGRGCNKKVFRMDSDPAKGCLHYEDTCRYCDKPVQVADLEEHYNTDCSQHTTKCQHCNTMVVRHRLPAHMAKDCPDANARCCWHPFGCKILAKRRVVLEHEAGGCVYEAIGKLARDRYEDRLVLNEIKNQVTSLNGRLRQLEAEQPRPPRGPNSERWRMGFSGSASNLATTTAAGQELSPGGPVDPDSGIMGQVAATPFETRDDYMLAQFERMELRMEDLRKALNEMDGRHSMMLLNEVMPLKEQIAEMRSNLGVLNMHTTWLMNFQRRNRGNAGGPASGNGISASSAGGAGGSRDVVGGRREEVDAGGVGSLRRMSDGLRENPPRL